MRTMSLRILYKKVFKTFPLSGVWLDVLGTPEVSGAWIVYGPEKNGKTWFSLLLADMISQLSNVLYISAEEGLGYGFVEACKRAKLETRKGLQFSEYIGVEELNKRLQRQRSPKVVFIDNITVYNDELKNGALRRLLKSHPTVLFVFIAHEEKGQPYTATAKLAQKLANIIFHVQGLTAIVHGRCPGGLLYIDEEKAKIIHGEPSPQKQQKAS